MKRQKTVELLITDINERGEGIGRVDGKVHFVDGAVPGDWVRVEIIQEKKAYNKARIIKLLQTSEYRIEPNCQFAYRCGGCSVQQIDYAEQLGIKAALVRDALVRIGGQKDYEQRDIIGMEEPYRYRNKAIFPAAEVDGKLKLGLYKRGSHQIVTIDDCLIQNEICRSVIEIVEQWAADYSITAYNEKRSKGQLRHIMVRSTNRGQHMVGIISGVEKVPYLDDLVERLCKAEPSIIGVVQNINASKGNRILGKQYKTLYGAATIVDSIGKIDYELSMASFFQVNPAQTIKLFNTAIALAELSGEQIVWDIYCGAGSIALQLAGRAKWVYGNEIVAQAIVDAKANAARNKIENVSFIEGAAEAIVPTWLDKYPRPEVVFLDPPRKGADQKVLQAIVDIAPNKIVYVSCKPSTLARDIKYLSENGYSLKIAVPVDMFAHTMHVECVALMTKQHID